MKLRLPFGPSQTRISTATSYPPTWTDKRSRTSGAALRRTWEPAPPARASWRVCAKLWQCCTRCREWRCRAHLRFRKHKLAFAGRPGRRADLVWRDGARPGRGQRGRAGRCDGRGSAASAFLATVAESRSIGRPWRGRFCAHVEAALARAEPPDAIGLEAAPAGVPAAPPAAQTLQPKRRKLRVRQRRLRRRSPPRRWNAGRKAPRETAEKVVTAIVQSRSAAAEAPSNQPAAPLAAAAVPVTPLPTDRPTAAPVALAAAVAPTTTLAVARSARSPAWRPRRPARAARRRLQRPRLIWPSFRGSQPGLCRCARPVDVGSRHRGSPAGAGRGGGRAAISGDRTWVSIG